MDVRKTITDLTSKLSEINYDSEEEVLCTGTNPDSAHSLQDLDYGAFESSNLRKTNVSIVLPEHIYGGNLTTREKSSFEEVHHSKFPKEVSGDESDYGSIHNKESVVSENENSVTSEADSSETEASEDTSTSFTKKNISEHGLVNYNIYSAESRGIPNDVKKGTAVKNQLKIWESLLECRIKLQKALVACNRLPLNKEIIKSNIWINSENQQNMNGCTKNLLVLIEKMIHVQMELLKQCQEYGKNPDIDVNEEIKSDDESELSTDLKQDIYEEEDNTPRKKRKLNHYSYLIKNNHFKFIPFRNASIQKWNDKTKIATGKIASSNFSAFDQSTLKQIEQIMADKNRLINRTRVNRNECQDNKINNQEPLKDVSLSENLFDDTDFYHKLLRDYIEQKSVDVTNSSHTERQLIELQKLRSKMKKDIDTKSTKGRKLRYVVMPKLVNFMGPDPYNTWSEQAETELYNSLFGKISTQQ